MSQDVSLDAKKPSNKVSWSWIIGGILVLVIAAGFGLKALDGAFTYYVTTDEFVDNREDYEGKNLKVAGFVQAGSLKSEANLHEFIVELQGRSFPVSYRGFIPDTFKEGAEVVVEGREKVGSEFKAKSVMAKCASKYEVGDLPPLKAIEETKEKL